MNLKPKVVAICGPTGVGKTELSILVAKHFSAEIINFDSQQFYKELVIGTAKPTPEEQKGVPHHLFEELSLREEMSAGKFVELADRIIEEIQHRGNLPLLVGGTGLYLRAFEYGIFQVKVDKTLREALRDRAKGDVVVLYEELKEKDPLYASKIHPRDKVRIIRALEVIYSTGKPFSSFHRETPFFQAKRYPLLKIGLYLPREELYAKLNQRVKIMIQRGWLQEVENILKVYGKEIFSKIKAIGYRTLLEVLEGKRTLESAIEIIQRDTRRYAKRQLTWFRKERDLIWFKPDEQEKILEKIGSFLYGE
ncbi:MAG: tRNA (adenosine(37)-N6)-dimethylallyltransferase MiaA [Caldimicrobium sp.]|nr:tRNA (adenosine(37)-N6)-dimethylallyltransferase MiaA [Caldimicrobium sp.]MCX7874060.1 tRNA (adenosine(37)-N6)-dimethylallyltransferase MiaA [Caldimicrobium sp.]MDW8093884.1 tRNA (adenosine(37)-N6)-dimethylallyltransferase MiaA [Caldimicrobium sp.]